MAAKLYTGKECVLTADSKEQESEDELILPIGDTVIQNGCTIQELEYELIS